MFNDKYGLTDAVLRGDKTMTRRIVSDNLIMKFGINKFTFEDKKHLLLENSLYEIDKIVAVAQSYKSFQFCEMVDYLPCDASPAGWTNKMFVKAEYMHTKFR